MRKGEEVTMQRAAGQNVSPRLQCGVGVAPASLSLLTHASLPVGSSLPVPSVEPSDSCHALDSQLLCAYSQARNEVKGTTGPLNSTRSSKDIVNIPCHFYKRTEGVLRLKAALSIGYRQSDNAKAWESFNRSVRWNCSSIPLGLAALSQELFGKQENLDNGEEGEGGREDAAAGGRPKVVLILMSDTGGGHRASAEAIKTTFALEYGDEYKVIVTDLWTDHTPWPFNQLPKSYNFLVKHSTLWKFTFHGTAPRLIHQPHFAVTSAFIARKVMRGLLNHKPDVIVSVHPLMQHIPLRILKAKGLLKKIPFTTVITDLSTCHPTWFHRLVTRCFCPTKKVAERAQKAGLRPSQIRVYGLPIRPSFCKALCSKIELRRQLGIDEELPAVLLMGGGEGMGPVEATARALGKSLYDEQMDRAIGQLVVICGKNKRLIKRLQEISWPMPVQIRGFEMNMNEWMGACDCIITKAGPGTIAEAMICGLPLLLNDYIAGQETGNVPYVVDNGAGKFCKDPKKIAHIVAEWFGPKQVELQQMSRNALKLARPDAVFKIVHDLDELARQKDSLREHVLALI